MSVEAEVVPKNGDDRGENEEGEGFLYSWFDILPPSLSCPRVITPNTTSVHLMVI